MRTWMLVAVAWCGCEKAGGDTKTIELPMPQVTVRLIDAGAEPRAPLRDDLRAGSRRTYKMTMLGTVDRPQRRAMPPRTSTFEMVADDVSADGTRHVRTRVLDASDAFMRGRSTESWVDARGVFVHPSRVTAPAEADLAADKAGTPEQMMVAPEDAVGVGARWHEDITFGARTSSVDVELLTRDGAHVRTRARYHRDDVIAGKPVSHDGTIDLDLDVADGSRTVHHVDEMTMHDARGRSSATITTDVVPVP